MGIVTFPISEKIKRSGDSIAIATPLDMLLGAMINTTCTGLYGSVQMVWAHSAKNGAMLRWQQR